MNAARPFKLSVVYEFAGQRGHMMHSLVENLGSILPGMRVTYIGGLFATYRPGGFRPQRLVNLLWVYIRVAVHLILGRPDAVLVQSAPPGVPLWTVAWAAIGRVPVFYWLMDYHPEFEARWLERRGQRGLARFLRSVDAYLMPRFAAIITLDPAMTSLAGTRASPKSVLEHPTWVTDETALVAPVSFRPGSGGGPLRLAYSGSLGAAHDLAPLSRLLRSIARRRTVRLFVIGGSPKGRGRFRELGAELGVAVEMIPRVPNFADLRGVFERLKIDAGIVLLAQESAGLVSPSKFSGYINFGLPLVYVGPSGTSASAVCARFKGGFWLSPQAGPEETERIADELLDEGRMAAASAGACEAAAHFAGFNGKSLAMALAPHMLRRFE